MKVALILLVAVARVSGSPRSKGLVHQFPEKIIGGTEANRGEFPWMVSLEYYGSHICGASIVNAYWIVTAAHCADMSSGQYTIVAGDHNQRLEEGSEQTRTVVEVIVHPNYDDFTFANDIALIRLNSPLVFNEFVQPANIAGTNFNPSSNVVVTGWGITSETGSRSDVLMKVIVPYVSYTACKELYNDDVYPGMICAGTGGKDSCAGDSGGPLHSGDILVGLVSWGYGCARPQYPGVYTSLMYFSSWISENIS